MVSSMTKAKKRALSTRVDAPAHDVWVCEGRMCKSFGAEELSQAATAAVVERGHSDRCRVLRGGCFGVCELAANVVVRRHLHGDKLPSPEDDRLSLTHRDNETVYSQVTPESIVRILSAHLDEDRVDVTQTQTAREECIGTRSTVAERMRALRERRKARQS
jgi:(2Fe-2S) ferredoxin